MQRVIRGAFDADASVRKQRMCVPATDESTSAGGSDAESEGSEESLSAVRGDASQRGHHIQGNPAATLLWLLALSCTRGRDTSEEKPEFRWKAQRVVEETPWKRRAPQPARATSKGCEAPVAAVFVPPPGLFPPPGLSVIGPPPGLSAPCLPEVQQADAVKVDVPFNPVVFRRELVVTLRELSVTRSVAGALQRIRALRVPRERQAAEFADLLTRAAEERRGSTRRLWWTLAASLAAGADGPSGSAFGAEECIEGLKAFFQETYADLCEEVFRLPLAVQGELMPALRSVFPEHVLEAVVPTELCEL